MTLLRFFFILLLFVQGVLLNAQTFNEVNVPEEELLQPSDLLDDEIIGQLGNDARIEQRGNDNVANIEQILRQGYNFAKVVQIGEDNLAFVLQNGSGNELYLMQRGAANEYTLNNVADDNKIVVIQDGDNNRIIQELNQANDLKIELVQLGNENEIIQILEGNVEARNFQVRQIGDGLKVEIRQSEGF